MTESQYKFRPKPKANRKLTLWFRPKPKPRRKRLSANFRRPNRNRRRISVGLYSTLAQNGLCKSFM